MVVSWDPVTTCGSCNITDKVRSNYYYKNDSAGNPKTIQTSPYKKRNVLLDE